MANIATSVTKIRTAVIGQDVRAGIADAMEAVNTDNIEIIEALENVDLPAAQAAAATAQNAAVTATQKSTQATGQADRAATAANLAIAAEENVSQYLETMSEQAVAATTAATTATQKSTQAVSAAETAVNNAHQAETFADDALVSATAAATAADQISDAVGQTTAKAAEALQSANTAETKATEATTAADTVLAALENLPEGNVTPEEKAAWNAKQNALGFTPENTASKGLANGYAALDASGKVPVSQLPESGTGDMLKSIYDTDNSGTVDNAEKVNGLTVETSVPADAAFSDTIYTHPESHPAAMIIEDSTHRFVTDTEKEIFSDYLDTVSEFRYSEFSMYCTNIDSKGVYINVEWKRSDNTTHAKSTLSGGTAPRYTTVTIDYYDSAGTTVEKSISWTLTYDDNDFSYQRVVA